MTDSEGIALDEARHRAAMLARAIGDTQALFGRLIAPDGRWWWWTTTAGRGQDYEATGWRWQPWVKAALADGSLLNGMKIGQRVA